MYILFFISPVLICLLSFIFKPHSKNGQIFGYFTCLILFLLIFCFRTVSIPDYGEYLSIFDRINPNFKYKFILGAKHYQTGVEYGFLWIILLFKKFIGDYGAIFYYIFSLTIYVLSMLSVYKLLNVESFNTNKSILCIEKEKYINNLALFSIYFSYFGLMYNAVAMRAGFVFPLCMLSLYFFTKKKYVYSLLLFIVSFTIDRMAILVCPLIICYYFIPKLPKLMRLIFIIVIGLFIFIFRGYFNKFIVIVSSFIFSHIPGIDYSNYLNNLAETNGLRKTIILNWLIGILFCVDNDFYSDNCKYVNIYWVGIVVSFLVSIIPGGSRIADLFLFMSIPLLYKWYEKSKMDSIIKSGIVFSFVFLNSLLSIRLWLAVM